MTREALLEKIHHGLSHIHDEIFPDINIEEILHEDDEYVRKALDKYNEYLNFTENQDKFNLKYCFKTTIQDLNDFYVYQEKRLEEMQEHNMLCDLEHKVNTHIYDEVITCQKKVNRYFLFNAFTTYFIAFTLIFLVTEVTHLLHYDTLLGTTIVAFIMALFKVFVDKRYLEIIRVRVGWKSYKRAVVRSLAFYFASVIVMNHCKHIDTTKISMETLSDLKEQVHDIIDILLQEVVLSDSHY